MNKYILMFLFNMFSAVFMHCAYKSAMYVYNKYVFYNAEYKKYKMYRAMFSSLETLVENFAKNFQVYVLLFGVINVLSKTKLKLDLNSLDTLLDGVKIYATAIKNILDKTNLPPNSVYDIDTGNYNNMDNMDNMGNMEKMVNINSVSKYYTNSTKKNKSNQNHTLSTLIKDSDSEVSDDDHEDTDTDTDSDDAVKTDSHFIPNKEVNISI